MAVSVWSVVLPLGDTSTLAILVGIILNLIEPLKHILTHYVFLHTLELS